MFKTITPFFLGKLPVVMPQAFYVMNRFGVSRFRVKKARVDLLSNMHGARG